MTEPTLEEMATKVHQEFPGISSDGDEKVLGTIESLIPKHRRMIVRYDNNRKREWTSYYWTLDDGSQG